MMAEPDAPKERDALNVSFADRAAVTPVAERNVLERSSSRSNVAELAERNVMEIERCVTVESPGSSGRRGRFTKELFLLWKRGTGSILRSSQWIRRG